MTGQQLSYIHCIAMLSRVYRNKMYFTRSTMPYELVHMADLFPLGLAECTKVLDYSVRSVAIT